MGIKEIAACLLVVVACASASDYHNCPTPFGFFPDSYDCTKFFRCSFGKAFQFTCAPGTRWSQYLLTCDYEHKVPCGHYPAAAAHEVYRAVPEYPDHGPYYNEPHGPAPHGPAHHGPAPYGPGPHGPAPHGPVPHAHPVDNGYYDFVKAHMYHKK